MIQIKLVLLALLFAGCARASSPAASADMASTPRPTGRNCALATPPASAGEIFTNAAHWRVYPRTADITPSYVGCQAVWAPGDHGRWNLVTLLVVRHSVAVAIWPAPPEHGSDHCHDVHGRIDEGSAPECSRLIVSVPAGCARRALQQGTYPVYPKGCNEDAPADRVPTISSKQQ